MPSCAPRDAYMHTHTQSLHDSLGPFLPSIDAGGVLHPKCWSLSSQPVPQLSSRPDGCSCSVALCAPATRAATIFATGWLLVLCGCVCAGRRRHSQLCRKRTRCWPGSLQTKTRPWCSSKTWWGADELRAFKAVRFYCEGAAQLQSIMQLTCGGWGSEMEGCRA